MRKFALIAVLLLSLLPHFIFAQQRQVRGTVTDETGASVTDATVALKGTTVATKTDANGNFIISIPAGLNNCPGCNPWCLFAAGHTIFYCNSVENRSANQFAG